MVYVGASLSWGCTVCSNFHVVARSLSSDDRGYALPTTDMAFKRILENDTARNSFISAVIEKPVAKSTPLDITQGMLPTRTSKTYETIEGFLASH